ncbi:TonB-dependent receptor [Telmatospirillum sp.]|uniref:TonB-dependent receptor n=1 Tax=Telmatospirillum sp. TaxID=2079197 RepID=UPI002841DA6E|nr:TonB-dependent receptor [Telmatospirillum sp.]MDR3438572.1 TonB-dependent receptor [Telmatospirillum sp.]
MLAVTLLPQYGNNSVALAEGMPVPAISAGTVSDALKRLALETGVNLLFISEAVRDKKTSGSHHAETVAEALRQILAGTDLDFTAHPNGSFSVAARPAPTPAPAATTSGPPPAAARRDMQEVTITADRIHDPAALRQIDERVTTAVLSADMMARAPDSNVAESLARLPGISVALTTLDHYLGGVDTAARGQGEFVSIRGLDSEFNVNLVNGVNVAQSMPYSRQMNLALMPPLGLDRIVVTKASTADMDGNAIGGTIDFRSPSAFDFSQSFTKIYTRGQIDSRALDYNLDAGGGTGQVETATKFGPLDQFGVYATAYYDHHNFVTSELDWQANDFGYRISDAKGNGSANSPTGDNLVLGGVNPEFSKGDIERYGGSLSLDWKGDDNTAFLRSTYGYSFTQQDIFQIGFQSRGLVSRTVLGDGLVQNQTTDAQLHYWFETNPELAELTTHSVGGTSDFGRWKAAYEIFYSWGQNSRPDHVETSWGLESPSDQYSYLGALGNPLRLTYANKYAIPLLTAAQLALVNDLSAYTVHNQGELNIMESTQHKGGGQIDLTDNVGRGVLDTVQFGTKYVASYRTMFDRDWSIAISPKGQTLAESPLVERVLPSVIPGIYDYSIPILNGDKVRSLILAGLYSLSPDDYNGNSMRGWERVAAFYAMAHLKQGCVEIVPGLRFENTGIDNTYWDMAGRQHHWATSHTTYNELLPSVFVNIRPTEGSVYRGGVWASYSRPSFFQLGGGMQTNVGSDGSLIFTEGNPHLKAIQATNFDLSAEWNNRRGGNVSLAGYYKQLQHYLYNSGSSFTAGNTTDTGTISITRPNNGGSAHVIGTELSASQRLLWLPRPLDGLGVGGNVTLQHSVAHLNDPHLSATNQMQGAPDRLANFFLFYDQGGLSANLSYRYTGYYIEQYGEWGSSFFNTTMNGSDLNKWIHPTGTLDFSVRYRFENGIEIGAAVTNLLGGYAYYSTIGKTQGTVPQIIDAGRLFQTTMSVTF